MRPPEIWQRVVEFIDVRGAELVGRGFGAELVLVSYLAGVIAGAAIVLAVVLL